MVQLHLTRVALLGACLLMGAPEELDALPPAAAVDEARVVAGEHGAVAVTDGATLAALEARGYSLGALFGAPGDSARALVRTPIYASLLRALDADLEELAARPGIGGPNASNHAFDAAWLRSSRARFELVGLMNRLDRTFAEPGCGEARLVYRLSLAPPGRPVTRLPMTVNVMIPHPSDCREAARAWLDVPRAGKARVDALAAILGAHPKIAHVEVDLQNLHGPSLRLNEDDHAEYLLRSFDLKGDALLPRRLLNTPRADLSDAEKTALVAWIRENFRAIDEGTHVVPEAFLAARTVSFTPRGLARPGNRVFASLLGERAAEGFAGLPFDAAKLARSPRALLRRLDEATCNGCHESRAVAGFHLLGDERDPGARFNALAVGRSPHLLEELGWREGFVRAVAAGERYDAPRPFAERTSFDGYGAHCGLGDPGFASWTCAPGLKCRDANHDEIGICVPADANHVGDACQNARVVAGGGSDGDVIAPERVERCTSVDGAPRTHDACSPNAYGFPGGNCMDECTAIGEVKGDTVCADLPASGYETECFPLPVPIEECLKTHTARRRVRTCDATTPCRDDYGCARVPGLPPEKGACVPPYFVFQARVDGPALDR